MQKQPWEMNVPGTSNVPVVRPTGWITNTSIPSGLLLEVARELGIKVSIHPAIDDEGVLCPELCALCVHENIRDLRDLTEFWKKVKDRR